MEIEMKLFNVNDLRTLFIILLFVLSCLVYA
jgi:hypothetical protein